MFSFNLSSLLTEWLFRLTCFESKPNADTDSLNKFIIKQYRGMTTPFPINDC